MVGLRRAIATDWSLVRHTEQVWTDECRSERESLAVCARALHAQIRAMGRLVEDVSAQPLGGTTLAPIVYGRFLPAVGAALAARRAASSDIAAHNLARFQRDDRDPMICVQPLNAAMRRGLDRFAGLPFLSYSAIWRRSC